MSDKYSISIGPGNRIGAVAVGPGARANGEVPASPPRRITDGTPVTTWAELAAVLDEVAIRGWLSGRLWRFQLEHVQRVGGDDGWLVSVTFERQDRETGVASWGRSRPLFVPHGATAREVWGTAFVLLKLTMEHELLEAFHVGERRVFDPHAPMVSGRGNPG